jgi:hypothetical protein
MMTAFVSHFLLNVIVHSSLFHKNIDSPPNIEKYVSVLYPKKWMKIHIIIRDFADMAIRDERKGGWSKVCILLPVTLYF